MAGSVPEMYRLIRAAKFLGVAPWELANQPLFWQEYALEYEGVDAEAAQILSNVRN